ncbi:AMP-binding protein [Nocardia suismassiliense]|uniref:AMP-binding protein n=1 Tax=Nocardia suismassiliense TaxID=2077092 RepID=UPI000D1E643D|nr:AMP-binding protein [Nocardia suismassiliense]
MTVRDKVILRSPDSAWKLTRDQLDAWTDKLAKGFRSAGIGCGDVVVTDLPNSPAAIVTLHASWAVGATAAPMNPLLTPREKKVICDAVRPKVIITSADWATAGVVAWPDPFTAPPDIDRTELQPVPGDCLVAEQDRLILFTSGSTGRPKAVALTADNVEAGIAAVTTHFKLSEEDRTVGLLPWSHGHGLFAVMLSTLRTGGTIVLAKPRETARPRQLLAQARPTWMTLVPPQVAMMTEAFEAAGTRAENMRFVRTASASLPHALAERAERVFGSPLIECLGLTETSHQMAANPVGWDRVIGSVGTPTGMAVRLAGENILGGGELEVRGRALFRAYLGDPEATTAAMTEDGWFRTRDVATIGEGGRIRIVGRLSEIINQGGHKVSPPEVEAVLVQHPDVAGALVTGIPHPTLGQQVAAAVRLREGATAGTKDLIGYCRAHLADYKVPSRMMLVKSLPQLPNAKPSRRLAAELFEANR